VSNRSALEAKACECHRAVKQHFETVLGAVYGTSGTLIALRPAAS